MADLVKLRTVFYSLVLGFGVVQTIISSFCGIFDGFSDLRLLFGRIALGVSVPTWVWTSVLLAYHNRPLQSHIFTKKTLHLISFVLFAIVWLVIGIVLLTQAPTECDFERYSDGLAGIWCGFTAATGTGGLVLAILCATTAVFVHRSQASEEGNIAGPQQKADEER
ncbi:hypothetical protein CVT24_006559 [Panaeolus cyanescens]|uniref:MARVEL domain-containing protein n=1 Tax=Panaeolus cyanescens TaxID=181874 RepID=A0A409WBV4_9AGAR|nr:hypothetical protein CVT24_006559 [Panaeolus cyanescens]